MPSGMNTMDQIQVTEGQKALAILNLGVDSVVIEGAESHLWKKIEGNLIGRFNQINHIWE